MRKLLITTIIILSVALAGCIGWAVSLQRNPQNPSLQETNPTGTAFPTEKPDPTEEPTQLPTQPPTEPPKEQRFTLTFVGDCTLGTMPDWEYLSYCFPKIIGTDYDKPFQYVRHLFENDDCTFVNLESVIASSGEQQDKRFTFIGPPEYINILTGSSVEAVNLANNHTLDFGEGAYAETKTILENNHVYYCEKDLGTLFTTESGLCIGLYGTRGTLDEEAMAREIAWMRQAGAQIVIASAHWGTEGAYHPTDSQENAAHTLIDAGVDIVWGHHPHVLQKIEQYNGGIIYYSLGNFSFGGNHNPKDKDTAILQQEIVIAPDGTVSLGKLTIIPCAVSTKTDSNDFQPIPVEEGSTQYDRILSKLDDTFTGKDLNVSYNN